MLDDDNDNNNYKRKAFLLKNLECIEKYKKETKNLPLILPAESVTLNLWFFQFFPQASILACTFKIYKVYIKSVYYMFLNGQ